MGHTIHIPQQLTSVIFVNQIVMASSLLYDFSREGFNNPRVVALSEGALLFAFWIGEMRKEDYTSLMTSLLGPQEM